MVHALSEIRRVLAENGILIDLRPITGYWPVEVASAREVRATGSVQAMPVGLADDEASNRAIEQAGRAGWFVQEQQEFFPFYYSWDSPKEMEEFIAEEWDDWGDLDEETRQATRSAWALGDADSQVRVKVKMLITRWRKKTTSMEY